MELRKGCFWAEAVPEGLRAFGRAHPGNGQIDEALANRELILEPDAACQQADQGDPNLTCGKVITINLFFDGTNNYHEAAVAKDSNNPKKTAAATDTHTNVARLHDACREDGTHHFRHYIQGVGTEFEYIGEPLFTQSGKAFATGFEARVAWGYIQTLNSLFRAMKGKENWDNEPAGKAALALSKDSRPEHEEAQLENLQTATGEGSLAKPYRIQRAYLNVFGFSRGAAEARVFVSRLMKHWAPDGKLCESIAMRRLTVLCLLLAGLSGVGVPLAVAQSDDWSEYDTIGASTMTVNYTPFRVVGYVVRKVDGYAIGSGGTTQTGSIERPNGLGGTMCCMSVPRKWKPGIKYRIEWELYPIDPDNEAPDEPWMHWYSAVVELPPFEDGIWQFAVQFLPGNRVRVNFDRRITYPAADDPYIAQGVLDEERTAEAAREYTPEKVARVKAYHHRSLELDKVRREQGEEAYWVEVNKDNLAGALEDLKKASPERKADAQEVVEIRREKLRKAEERFANKKKGGG